MADGGDLPVYGPAPANLPTFEEMSTWNVGQLRARAKELGMAGSDRQSRGEVTARISRMISETEGAFMAADAHQALDAAMGGPPALDDSRVPPADDASQSQVRSGIPPRKRRRGLPDPSTVTVCSYVTNRSAHV